MSDPPRAPSWPPTDVRRILEDALHRAELERLAVELGIAWAVHRRRHDVRKALSPGMLHTLDALERHTRKHPRRRVG